MNKLWLYQKFLPHTSYRDYNDLNLSKTISPPCLSFKEKALWGNKKVKGDLAIKADGPQ